MNNIFLGMIGPLQLIFLLGIPTIIFITGYLFGKKAGYVKRVKETESKN
ncbi:MAG: hypothetical protein HRT69_10585 [Flavobacteriaceae bacterium]|nr:hypothetical protein [Flavobacteriaceae bacterium]